MLGRDVPSTPPAPKTAEAADAPTEVVRAHSAFPSRKSARRSRRRAPAASASPPSVVRAAEEDECAGEYHRTPSPEIVRMAVRALADPARPAGVVLRRGG
jgi:hypothetical protein